MSSEAVYLDSSACIGCTTCMQRCPTEAIRVRNGKAVILRERCVDCGECVRVCPHHAMKAKVDALDEVLQSSSYMVALPSPALYGQFRGVDRRVILAALERIGFNAAFEVAAASEALSAITYNVLHTGNIPHPIITTSCPVILRIIRMRFPSLLPHLLNYRPPMEVAALWSKAFYSKLTGLPKEKIGCVYISPCPARYGSAKNPLGSCDSHIDGVVSIADVAPRLIHAFKEVDIPVHNVQSGAVGLSWAIDGGQSAACAEPNRLAASGMENIVRILEALEDGRLRNVDIVELNACSPGCVGGVLTVENPYIARARIEQNMRSVGPVIPIGEFPLDDLKWDGAIEPSKAMTLDDDFSVALEKAERIQALSSELYGINCGACGAPTCRALAEDIVSGRSNKNSCVFLRNSKAVSN